VRGAPQGPSATRQALSTLSRIRGHGQGARRIRLRLHLHQGHGGAHQAGPGPGADHRDQEGDRPSVDLHAHCTAGIAPMSYQAGHRRRVDILDTAMSPFAMGTSQPPTRAWWPRWRGPPGPRDLPRHPPGYPGPLPEDPEKYGAILDPISERVDSGRPLYQLPGGMISNLVSQLKEQDALNRMNDVYLEIPR